MFLIARTTRGSRRPPFGGGVRPDLGFRLPSFDYTQDWGAKRFEDCRSCLRLLRNDILIDLSTALEVTEACVPFDKLRAGGMDGGVWSRCGIFPGFSLGCADSGDYCDEEHGCISDCREPVCPGGGLYVGDFEYDCTDGE